MALKIARRAEIAPFQVLEVLSLANQRQAAGHDILHLEAGQPSTPAPMAVRRAVAESVMTEPYGYTEALGMPELRRRIAQHYRDKYGLDVDAARIAVTAGSSAAFLLSFLAAFEPGDRVALAAPGYPAYRSILKTLDLVPVEFETDAETGFQPTPEDLDALDAPIDGLIIASPSNPAGTVIDPAALEDLCRWCSAQQVRLVSDELYHGTVWGGGEATAAIASNSAIVVNSFSKYYCMTGWRLGWAVLPEDLVRPVEILAQNLFISPPTPSQIGALAALDCGEELDAHVARYRRNSEVLVDALAQTALTIPAPPQGAFYLYADCSALGIESGELARRLLNETGVAITPGSDFDPRRGHATLRMSYAGSAAEIDNAAERLYDWLITTAAQRKRSTSHG